MEKQPAGKGEIPRFQKQTEVIAVDNGKV